MKDTELEDIIQLTYVGNAFLTANQKAEELAENCRRGEVIDFKEVTARDLKFHRCYFDLLGTIYDYMPPSFKKRIEKNNFYILLKELQGEYKVLFDFKDGSKVKVYNSISFGKMSQKRFEEYVKNQLPIIYNEIIQPYFPDKKTFDSIVQTIEEDYQVFLSKLWGIIWANLTKPLSFLISTAG